ncbi:MAG: sugar ABC transporter permease [Clostridiales bacterium]|nr:sugar ABC transporter permease [Clostridiales bacterium]
MESMIYKNKKPLFLFLIPAFAFMLVFLYYPFLVNIINSFSVISGLGNSSTGINDPWYINYVNLFTDKKMQTALLNTLYMILGTIAFQVGMALILSLLVDNVTKGAQFFRTVYFFPIVISATALGLLFNMVFLFDGGMLNQLVQIFGGKNINWKGKYAMMTMFIPVMWQYIGFYFVILVTGLNNISEDIYEAAKIDGANGLKRVRYITLPLLHNVLITCVTLSITGALKVFDLPWVMFPNGMPLDTTWLTGTYMYYQTFNLSDVDYGSAISIAIVLIGVVLSRLSGAVFKEKDY